MRNKKILLVLGLSCLILCSAIYINLFENKIHFNNIDNYRKVSVFSNYKNKDIDVCYGNKLKCTPITYKILGSVNTKRLGTYTITYAAEKNGKKNYINKKVQVIDDKAPELNITGDFNNFCSNGKSSSINLSAMDNYDGDITDKIKYKISNNKITYSVSDSSGNIKTKTYNIKISDNSSPDIILNGDSVINLAYNEKYVEPGYSAIDNCDGNLSKKVNISGNVDIKKAGSYELVYKVEDSNKNVSTVKRIIKVFPKNDISKANYQNKTIYLTFDDGPSEYTRRLLEILKKYGVKATFFVTGLDSNNSYLIKNEFEDGHTIGLHSYTHNYKSVYSSVDSFMNEFNKIDELVYKYTNTRPKLIRFPGGSSNTISRVYNRGIMRSLVNKVHELGYKYYDWTVLSGDAIETSDSNEVVKNVVNSITADGSNIVLLHDSKAHTVDAIERIIQYGLENGYTFSAITSSTPEVHHGLNN